MERDGVFFSLGTLEPTFLEHRNANWTNQTRLSSRRKREAREGHERSQYAQKVTGLKAKIYNKKRHTEKIEMKKKWGCSVLRSPIAAFRANS